MRGGRETALVCLAAVQCRSSLYVSVSFSTLAWRDLNIPCDELASPAGEIWSQDV